MGWILLIVVVPVTGLILYLLWRGDRQNKRLNLKNLPMPRESESREEQSRLNVEKLRGRDEEWGRLASYLHRQGFPLYQHTGVTFIPTGEEYLDDVLEKMEQAERFIFAELFIMARGDIWDAAVEILHRKASQGVEIKLLFDDFGSMMRMPRKEVERLRTMGVEVKVFPPDGPVWNDDCVDIMIAPGATRDIHYHFLYGTDQSSRYDDATGLIKDPLDPGYGKEDVTWNGKGWKTESRREGGKWRSIATFPYSDFGVAAPKAGDSWFINVGRIARSGKSSKDFEYLLWSPNMESRSFVAPNAMGKLFFR